MKLIKKLFALIKKCLRIPRNFLRRKYLSCISPSYPFLDTDTINRIYHIKDNTIEDILLWKVYDIYDEFMIKTHHPSQSILLFEDTSVFNNSDIVLTSNGVYWDKKYFKNFSQTIPLDKNVISYNEENIKIKKSKKTEKIDYCFSMLGVHAEHWAHFLAQFLPKLYYAKEVGVFEEKITVVFPKYKDAQIQEIIRLFVSQEPNIACVFVDGDVEIQSAKLIYMPSASILGNHSKAISPIHFVIPQIVSSKLMKYLVNPLLNSASTSTGKNKEKIFLARRGTHRGVINNTEVEQYFIERGFIIVEPHKLSLYDKVDLFHSAEVVVGPFSSAFANLIFCKDETKVLIMSNLLRILDAFLPNISRKIDLNVVILTGIDESADTHSNYSIDVEKLDEAYNKLMDE